MWLYLVADILTPFRPNLNAHNRALRLVNCPGPLDLVHTKLPFQPFLKPTLCYVHEPTIQIMHVLLFRLLTQ